MCASFNPMVAEAVAILRGVQLAIDTGFVPLDLVSDATVVVGMVNDMKVHASDIGLVIDAIMKLLLSLPSRVLRVCGWWGKYKDFDSDRKASTGRQSCTD
ncbi:hypothetical protein QYF36_017014 [Acer negundo]|nr:hypothetical protein QYF36_017014 [Acer negundo]